MKTTKYIEEAKLEETDSPISAYTAMDKQYLEALKTEIKVLLAQAEKLAVTDMPGAIKQLNEIKEMLPQLKGTDDSRMSNKNVSYDKGTQEMLFLSRYGNILYEIGEYKDALEYYQKLEVKLPGNNKVYKSQGDCLRKLKQYQESLEQYDKGMGAYNADKSAPDSDKAALLNSRGLSYTALSKYEEALKDFNEAIKITAKSPNALYYCNKGMVQHLQGDTTGSLESFKNAHQLIKSGKVAEGLNSGNIKYIDRALQPFIGQLEQLKEINPVNDKVFEAREKNFIFKLIDKLGDSSSKEDDLKTGKHLIDVKKNVSKVKSDQQLKEYYSGCLFTFNQSYNTSVVINKDILAIDSDSRVDAVEKLISFIPLIGDKVSTVVGTIGKFIHEMGVKKAATNVCKFADSPTEFDAIAQDVILDVILQREKEIKEIRVQEYVLPQWASRFNGVFRKLKETKDEINKKLYGERNETDLQKLGYKLANEVIEKEISSGKFYEGKAAVTIDDNEKKAKLSKLLLELLDKDIKASQDNLKFEEKEENLPGIKTNKSCCCEIFAVSDIEYDNELLNKPELIKAIAVQLKTDVNTIINKGFYLQEIFGSEDFATVCSNSELIGELMEQEI